MLFKWLFITILISTRVDARGITSKLGASCLYVAANFTSFPFDCAMPDLAFKCRCQNQAFLGTITKCIETYAQEPHELSKAYKQLVNTCQAQGGKSWNFIDLVKVNENATNYMVPFDAIPEPVFKASLVWKAQKILDIQDRNNQLINIQSSSGSVKAGMIQNGKVVESEKIPKYDNLEELERIGIANIAETPRFILYNPVIVPERLYKISHKSVSNLLDKRNLATKYGLYIYAYWGALMIISVLVNIAQWTSPYHNNRLGKTKVALWCKSKLICSQIIKPTNLIDLGNKSIAEKTLKEMVDGPMGLFDSKRRSELQREHANFLSSTLLNPTNSAQVQDLDQKLKKIKKSYDAKKQQSKFSRNCRANLINSIYTMPVRLHAIVIIGYVILNVVFCCVNYDIVYPNTVFTCRKGQTFVAIADRTGIIGTIQLPLVYLLATRNNIASSVTGLSYRTFQLMHKWTSRIVFLLLIFHCIFYLLFVNVRGDYIERWGLLKWRCANTAFAVISLTMLVSFFKRFVYEFFKYSHRLLLIIFSVCSWYHCVTLGWIEYLAVAYFVWGAEYLIRFCKIVSSGGVLKGQCNVIYNLKTRQPESIRIVTNHSGWWKPFPGCYCWVKVLKPGMFFESHPFTVVSATNAQNYNQLVFIIRVKNGLTKKLANFIAKQPKGECSLNMLVEGPYGNNIPFKQYNESVLIAGGVGMAVIYSIAMDIAQIHRAQKLRGKRKDCSNKRTASLVWIIPNVETITAFKNEIESLANFKDMIQIHIFVTSRLNDLELKSYVQDCGLINPLGVLGSSYELKGFKGLATAILQSAKSANSDSKEQKLKCKTTRTDLDNALYEINGTEFTDIGLDNIETSLDLEKSVSATHEQSKDHLKLLQWLIGDNSKQFSINFEDKPFIQDELSSFISKLDNEKPVAVVSCGPSNLNVDVRLSVVKLLESGCFVDYYEEELLW